MKAIESELASLKANDTWEEVDHILPNAQVHRPIWRFKKKDDGRHKARLCFDGRFQCPGLDFFDTYSPVVQMETVRVLLSFSIVTKATVVLGDVLSTFVKSEVDADIFMSSPEGTTQGKVFQLKHSLYGLKQVAHLWWQDIHKYLCQELAFKTSPFDQCLYVKTMQSSFVFVLLYVDDLLVISTSASELEKVFQHLFSCFEIKRASTIKHYLGLNVEVTTSLIHLSQSSHIIKM